MGRNQTRSSHTATVSRRTALRLTGGVALASLAGCLSTATADDRDWQSLGYDAANTGYTQAQGPGDPEERWGVETASIGGSPAVVDDTVYVGTGDGTVIAIDLETGDERWRDSVGESIYDTPAVSDGRVYVAADESIHAFTTDGDEVWTADVVGAVSSACTVRDGCVHVSTSGWLYTFDAETGDELWRGQGNGPNSAPAVVDGAVYGFGSIDEFDDDGDWVDAQTGVVAHDADTGEERWRYEGRDDEQVPPPAHAPSVDDDTDRLYLGTTGAESERLLALDRSTGDERWRTDLPGYPTHPPVVTEDTVYVGISGRMDPVRSDDDAVPARVVAVDAETGDHRWERELDAISAAIARGADALYCRTLGGLLALEPEGGATIWHHDSEFGPSRSTLEEQGLTSFVAETPQPAVVDETVVVTSIDAGVYAVGEA